MRYYKFNESESLSASGRRRLEGEEEARRNREFDLISEDEDFGEDGEDEDFDGGLPEEPDEDARGGGEPAGGFGDDADDDFDGDEGGEGAAPGEFEDGVTDYDCDAIASAVQGAVDKISAIRGLSIKSFAGSVVVNGSNVDFRVRTRDGEITGISVEDIVPVAQISSAAAAMDSINGMLSGSEDGGGDIDESRFYPRG